MSTYTTAKGVVYYQSPEDLYEVMSTLFEGKWLTSDGQWQDEAQSTVGPEQPFDFHPIAPALLIPWHHYRNHRRSRLTEGAEKQYLCEVFRGTGIVVGDNTWSIELLDWAAQREDSPYQWDDDNNEYVFGQDEYPVDQSEANTLLTTEFLNRYGGVSGLIVSEDLRLTYEEYELLKRILSSEFEDRLADDRDILQSQLTDFINEYDPDFEKWPKLEDSSLLTKLEKRPDHGMPDLGDRFPPDFAE